MCRNSAQQNLISLVLDINGFIRYLYEGLVGTEGFRGGEERGGEGSRGEGE